MEYPLTNKQQEFFDLIEGTQDNYFLCGPPGTGKSVITRALEAGRKSWTVCAPTGLAALNANGKTLHKTFRLPTSDGIMSPTYNNFPIDSRVVNFLRYQVKHLLIDEISMVRCDTLDYIDRLLRFVKRNPQPFGGIQVVVVGDFFQLPPVAKSGDTKALKECGWKSVFAFDSIVWETFKVLSLTENLRQKDDRVFIELLRNARTGDLSAKQMVLLNDRVDTEPKNTIQLYAWNAQADALNQRKLNELPGEKIEFEADSFGDWPAFPCDTILNLKIGAQVMVKLNGADRPPDHEGDFVSDVVNGTMGVVVEINGCNRTRFDVPHDVVEALKDGVMEPNENVFLEKESWNVVIKLPNGQQRTIYRKRWERKEKVESSPGVWEENLKASFEQIPLSLAWAISMHKSQGQTFDRVHIDGSKVFAAGQLYVALSRCRTLEGITLQSRLHKDRFKTDPDVIKFAEPFEPKPFPFCSDKPMKLKVGCGKLPVLEKPLTKRPLKKRTAKKKMKTVKKKKENGKRKSTR